VYGVKINKRKMETRTAKFPPPFSRIEHVSLQCWSLTSNNRQSRHWAPFKLSEVITISCSHFGLLPNKSNLERTSCR